MENNLKKANEMKRSISNILRRHPELKEFDRHNKLRNLGLRTRRNHLQSLSTFVDRVKKPFDKVTKRDVENFIISLDKKTKNNKEPYSESTKIQFKIKVKSFFRWFYKMKEKEYPEVVEWIKILPRRNGNKLPQDLLTKKEVLKLANGTDNLRDKTLILVLYESACRVEELCNLKIKDILFDDYGAIISVTGKTGDRKIRLIDTVPLLRDWLNNHPRKNNPEAYLFVNKKRLDEGLTDYGVRTILRRLRKSLRIKKKIYPHLFRHTRLTELAKEGYNETFLKHYAGWTQSSRMPEIYIHASAKDIDDMMLRKEGLLKKEEVKEEILKPIGCFKCGEKNSPTNRFCGKCATPLDQESQEEIDYTIRWKDFIRRHVPEIREIMKMDMQKEEKQMNFR